MSAPHSVGFFRDLTCPTPCGLKEVSAPRPVFLSTYRDLSTLRLSPGCEWPSIGFLLYLDFVRPPYLPSPGSKYPFIQLVHFRCSNVSFPLCVFQKVNFFCIRMLPVFSYLCFLPLQVLFSKLQSFTSNVLLLLLFSHFILVSPIYLQPPLCISSDNTHHTMIGTFSLHASVFSNIQNSDGPYSGPCLHFLCFSIPSDSRRCFGSSIFPIQIF